MNEEHVSCRSSQYLFYLSHLFCNSNLDKFLLEHQIVQFDLALSLENRIEFFWMNQIVSILCFIML